VVADVFGLEHTKLRDDPGGAQGAEVPLVTRDRAGPALLKVAGEGAEVVDLIDSGGAVDEVEMLAAEGANVEPATIGSAASPCLAHGVVDVESIDEEAHGR
jgi:hypothetical protein